MTIEEIRKKIEKQEWTNPMVVFKAMQTLRGGSDNGLAKVREKLCTALDNEPRGYVASLINEAIDMIDSQPAPVADIPVFYCENADKLEGLEKGALAVLSNLLMRTNATSAEFMIGNDKDGEFYFTCRRGAK